MMQNIIKEAQDRGQRILTEIQSKEILSAAGIPAVKTLLARSKEEAQQLASTLGFPTALKVCSPVITHKTDIGGVSLNLSSAEEVGRAYERIVNAAQGNAIDGVAVQQMVSSGVEVITGTVRDPQFGPMVMFGLGGIFVEVLEDVTFRIVPLTAEDASEMISEIKGRRMLEGARGMEPVNKEALVDVLLKLSHLVEKTPQISEIDINPLFADAQGAAAADARIVLT